MNNIKICVIGLGYVGLPIAVKLSKKFSVVGYDLDKERIKELKKKNDTTNEVDLKSTKLKVKNLKFTSNEKEIKRSNFFIITVPTPVDKNNIPDLSFLKSASITVSRYLKKNDTVVYESTTYPGCTNDYCIPTLEKYSNLKLNKDFYCGYSPERINPGDTVHKIENINKIISASNKKGLEVIKKVYKNVTRKKLVITKSIKIAEAAKIIENTQRDINIALMNELSMLFDKLNIDFEEILKAANTKWNFLNFKPGLVGGHCIGVDPYYLAFEAKKKNFNTNIILSGRKTNEKMYKFVVNKFINEINKKLDLNYKKKILVVGLTFKENVPDCRNSQSIKIVKYLKKKRLNVFTFDPLIEKKVNGCKAIKNFKNLNNFKNYFDGVIILVPHKEIIEKGYFFFLKLCKKKNIFFDIKNCFKKNSNFKL